MAQTAELNLSGNPVIKAWSAVVDGWQSGRESAAAEREFAAVELQRRRDGKFLQFFRDHEQVSGWLHSPVDPAVPSERLANGNDLQMLSAAERATNYLTETDNVSVTAEELMNGKATIRLSGEARDLTTEYVNTSQALQSQLDSMAQKARAEAGVYSGIIKAANWLLTESKKHKGWRRIGCLAAAGALAITAVAVIYFKLPHGGPGIEPVSLPDGHDNQPESTQTPTSSPTASHAPTAFTEPNTATHPALASATHEPTGTPLPPATPLGGIEGCRPITSLDQAIAHDATGQGLPSDDMRSGWNTVPDNVNPNSMACFAQQVAQAHEAGVLEDKHVTTFDRIADLAGVAHDQVDSQHPTIVLQADQDFSHLNQDLQTHDTVGVVTAAADLSRTAVHISDQLAILGRELLGGKSGLVPTSTDIFRGLTNGLGLEGMWTPGIDPNRVDEANTCLEIRPVANTGNRLDQEVSTVRAHWGDEPTAPRLEIFRDGAWQLANADKLQATIRLVDLEELNQLKAHFKDQNAFFSSAKISDGKFVVMVVHDMDNEQPNSNPVLKALDAAGHGSGGQLVPCGTGKETPAPEKTPEKTSTPSATSTATQETPPTQPTPPTPQTQPTGTPSPDITRTPTPTLTRIIETLTAFLTKTLTPSETLKPTNTPETPTPILVTPAPSITSQPPIPSATTGPTDEATMTRLPTWTRTPIDTEAQETDTPVPPTPLPNTNTPWPALFERFMDRVRSK